MAKQSRKVLVVDDNRLYREAIGRNLEFADYQVSEAEDLKSALEEIRMGRPQVVLTDLDMTHRTEGLDLIKEVKMRYPMMPVILVSAVGTFEEGALARELGATTVISKSRIDEELEHLYDCLDEVFERMKTFTSLKSRVDEALESDSVMEDSSLEEEINQLIGTIKFDDSVKGELFEWANHLKDRALAANPASVTNQDQAAPVISLTESHIAELNDEIGPLDSFDPETQSMILAAEGLATGIDPESDVGLARNIGFSYSFAVENEVKHRTGKKFAKFLSSRELKSILPKLYDRATGNLTLGLSRYLLLSRDIGQEITQDLTRQILERIARHEDRYKADGLKALGVILHLFGRDHSFQDFDETIEISNPLGMQGLDEEETTRLGVLLIRLQHTRNPYIHPEFSEREKLSEMRRLVLDCLKLIKKVPE